VRGAGRRYRGEDCDISYKSRQGVRVAIVEDGKVELSEAHCRVGERPRGGYDDARGAVDRPRRGSLDDFDARFDLLLDLFVDGLAQRLDRPGATARARASS
jgi:hypothetical protein